MMTVRRSQLCRMLDLTLDRVDCQPSTFGRFPLARPIATHLRQNDLSVPPTRNSSIPSRVVLHETAVRHLQLKGGGSAGQKVRGWLQLEESKSSNRSEVRLWASLCVAVRWHFHRPHQRHDGLPNVLRQVRPASENVSGIKLGLCQWVTGQALDDLNSFSKFVKSDDVLRKPFSAENVLGFIP